MSGERRSLVVVPTYNERANLPTLVGAVRAQGCDVLVVDDASPDGTGEVADRLAAQDQGLEVLHRRGKLGLGSAYREGLTLGAARGYDFLITMDGDRSHRPAHLPEILAAASSAPRVVIGSRYVPGGSVVGWPRRRRLLSYAANLYCRSLLGIEVHDCTSGYRCYPRQAVERMRLETVIADGYAFLIETLYRCITLGTGIVEVPIRFEDRVAGKSKVSAQEILKALSLVPRLRLGSARIPREAEMVEVELTGVAPRRAPERVAGPPGAGGTERPGPRP